MKCGSATFDIAPSPSGSVFAVRYSGLAKALGVTSVSELAASLLTWVTLGTSRIAVAADMKTSTRTLIFYGLVVCLPFSESSRIGRAQQATGDLTNEKAALQSVIAQVIADEAHVCDVVTFTVEPTQTPSILASLDFSGRHFCNTVVRVADGKPPRVLQKIHAWGADDLSNVAKDVDQDGNLELVIPREFSSYEGAACLAVTPIVYTCSESSCVDSSSRYPEFYRQQLFAAQEAMVSLSPEREEGLPCLIMNRDKAMRLLGIEHAGFDQAEDWMKSSDPTLRRKAVQIFADIHDAPARQRLAILSKDADPTVAGLAQMLRRAQ